MLAGCGVSSSSSAVPAVPVAAVGKLHLLRESFANPQLFQQAGSLAGVSHERPIVRVRPSTGLASDQTLDSVWVSKGDTWGEHSITLLWRSGVVETIERWRCNCEAAAGLRRMGHEKPFRFLMLRGAPAITAPSNPNVDTDRWIGPIPPAEAAYGAPASVETIRDGYNITLWRYGADAEAGLVATAETLPVAHTAVRVHGYEAGGVALGNWNGRHGIDVAPIGGARFGIGVALKNISSRPLTITGVSALNGFIRLVGVHFRPYTPPTWSAIGPLIVRAPYDATPAKLDYRLQPGAWVGVQLDYQVQDPCVHWSQTIYDRTVEVTYTQGNRTTQIQEAPMVPLNITRRGAC
jgi:hypothetical protein